MQPSPVARLLKQWLLTVWNSLSYFSLLSPLTALIPLPKTPNSKPPAPLQSYGTLIYVRKLYAVSEYVCNPDF